MWWTRIYFYKLGNKYWQVFFNLSHLESADDVCSQLEMLILNNENDETEATITNGQSRDIGNTVHTRHKTKIKKKIQQKKNKKKYNTTQETKKDEDLVQAFQKKWWVESDFKAPNIPLSLRSK